MSAEKKKKSQYRESGGCRRIAFSGSSFAIRCSLRTFRAYKKVKAYSGSSILAD